ncbi:MAG: hypothetical protein IJE53_00825 [Bacilli bacterium]|nr:hypothetical protein [Bacilli bacterium]
MEFIILDLDTATEEQLKAAIECNYRTFRLMSSKIETLKKANEQALKKAQQKKEETFHQEAPVEEVVDDIDAEFEEEVAFFVSDVKKLPEEAIEENIESVLPSRKHYEYERLLKRIIAELFKDYNEIEEYMLTETMDPEEQEELLHDQAIFLRKIKAISKQLTLTIEEITQTPAIENELIFVPTSGGNIRVFDELDHIPSNYYKKFESLFASIKDGTFKGVKKMQGSLEGLAEVRDIPSGSRVTFMRLDKNRYAVISAFVKKSDNNSGYQKMVENHYQSYRQQETALKANLDNPEFLELHKQYELELFRKLSPLATSKSPLSKKVVQ